ncbi:hypothetical protein L1785_00530 [Antribacter sp. KLBMP9083]|uniref:Uncharacterized protein n=1 Tax=Antribacter soli TaxID=2910976 RepID=A0AA41QAC3_9MICO|nr:hypothetical protein [Antribacter soli]MCF4119467.1 hypothetical protein [Antribacter soli]
MTVGQCEEAGVTRKHQRRLLDCGTWTRVTTGVLDTSAVDPRQHRNDVRRLRSVWTGLLAYPGSVAVGACALMLLGVRGLPRDLTPEVALPGGQAGRPRDGIQVRQYTFDLAPVVVTRRRMAAVEWAFAQALPDLPRFHAVAALDSARNQGLIDDAGLARVRGLLWRRRSSTRCRSFLDDVDGRAESPPETFARLQCQDAGIGPDDLQRNLYDDGRFLGRGDLLWYLGDGRWLVVEMDSAQFYTGDAALRHDTSRQNGLVGRGGLVLLRYYADQLWPPGAVTGEITYFLRKHGWAPGRALPSMSGDHDIVAPTERSWGRDVVVGRPGLSRPRSLPAATPRTPRSMRRWSG